MKKQITVVALVAGTLFAPSAFAKTPKVGEIEKISEFSNPVAITCSHESGRQGKFDSAKQAQQESGRGRGRSSQAD